MSGAANGTRDRRGQLVAIALFCLIAFGLAWLACLPLWMGPGLSDPLLFAICGGSAMVTPAVAALATSWLVEGRSWRRPRSASDLPQETRQHPAAIDRDTVLERDTVLASVGLRARGGPRRLIGGLAVALIAPVLLLLTSQLLAGLIGTMDLDLALQQTAVDLGLPPGASALQVWLAFGGRLLFVMAVGGAVNLILALGEEVGWRGFLMPRLEQFGGRTLAILGGGIIWGLWHAPLVLLGYNYPDAAPWVGLLAMIAACTGMGGFLYWLTIRFGSVWPAGLAHGVNNATSGIIMAALLAPGSTLDEINGSAIGWPGWVVYGSAVLIGFILIRGRRSAFPADAGPRVAEQPSAGHGYTSALAR